MRKSTMRLVTIVCAIFGVMQSVKGFEKDQNTVGLWNLNEGKGMVLHDISGNDINLHLYAPADKKENPVPKWIATPGGQGVLFRAEDGRQFNGKAPKLKDQLTFEAWIKPVNNGKRMGLYQAMSYQTRGYRINLATDLKVNFLLNGKKLETALRSKTALNSGEWAHVACTYDGKTAKIYINGKLDAEKELPGYDLSNVKYSTLGYTGGTPYFNGIIDSIKISNTPLTDFSKSLAVFKK